MSPVREKSWVPRTWTFKKSVANAKFKWFWRWFTLVPQPTTFYQQQKCVKVCVRICARILSKNLQLDKYIISHIYTFYLHISHEDHSMFLSFSFHMSWPWTLQIWSPFGPWLAQCEVVDRTGLDLESSQCEVSTLSNETMWSSNKIDRQIFHLCVCIYLWYVDLKHIKHWCILRGKVSLYHWHIFTWICFLIVLFMISCLWTPFTVFSAIVCSWCFLHLCSYVFGASNFPSIQIHTSQGQRLHIRHWPSMNQREWRRFANVHQQTNVPYYAVKMSAYPYITRTCNIFLRFSKYRQTWISILAMLHFGYANPFQGDSK